MAAFLNGKILAVPDYWHQDALQYSRVPNSRQGYLIMDNNAVKFLLKLMVASALISLGIKYIGPLLGIPSNSAIALIAVLLPPLFLGGILSWRLFRTTSKPSA